MLVGIKSDQHSEARQRNVHKIGLFHMNTRIVSKLFSCKVHHPWRNIHAFNFTGSGFHQKLSPLQFSENRRLNARIAEATEDLEELKSKKEQIMTTFGKSDGKGMKDVKAWIDRREEQIQKAEAADAKYSAELDMALEEYHDLEVRAEALDPDELETARLSLRPEEEKRAVSKVEAAYGNSYDYATMREAKNQVADLLGEDHPDSKTRSVRRDLQQAQEKVSLREQERAQQRMKKAKNLER